MWANIFPNVKLYGAFLAEITFNQFARPDAAIICSCTGATVFSAHFPRISTRANPTFSISAHTMQLSHMLTPQLMMSNLRNWVKLGHFATSGRLLPTVISFYYLGHNTEIRTRVRLIKYFRNLNEISGRQLKYITWQFLYISLCFFSAIAISGLLFRLPFDGTKFFHFFRLRNSLGLLIRKSSTSLCLWFNPLTSELKSGFSTSVRRNFSSSYFSPLKSKRNWVISSWKRKLWLVDSAPFLFPPVEEIFS